MQPGQSDLEVFERFEQKSFNVCCIEVENLQRYMHNEPEVTTSNAVHQH